MEEIDSPISLKSLDTISLKSSYTPKSETSIDSPHLTSPNLEPPKLESPQNLASPNLPDSPQEEEIESPVNNKSPASQWEKLDEKWNKILLPLPDDEFYVKDCPSDGNCQFRSLEEALRKTDQKFTHRQLRKLIGDYIISITDDDFQHLLTSYQTEEENGEFIGKWQPSKIKNKKQLKGT